MDRYIITIERAGSVSAHPYMPLTHTEAYSVARELARDFADARVYLRDLNSGHIVTRFAGIVIYHALTA